MAVARAPELAKTRPTRQPGGPIPNRLSVVMLNQVAVLWATSDDAGQHRLHLYRIFIINRPVLQTPPL
jgi:hypothetical protein